MISVLTASTKKPIFSTHNADDGSYDGYRTGKIRKEKGERRGDYFSITPYVTDIRMSADIHHVHQETSQRLTVTANIEGSDAPLIVISF
ncbi:hypothetical protein E4T56_gene12407 [Termitomyces sp. T112]|nr:hypothetical protein E4T56_gene12407 [Termitomyces sp. T112]